MNFVHFGRRMKIEELFYEWCEVEGIAKKPNSMVVFLMKKGWLNEEQIIKDLADTPQKDFPTEWCVHCELWREDRCIGVAQCKQNIKALKELSDLYEADTPQTDCP